MRRTLREARISVAFIAAVELLQSCYRTNATRVDERNTVMSRKYRNVCKKELKPRCPECHKTIGFIADRLTFGLEGASPLIPGPGDLTECEHCLAMLEYSLDSTSLTLRLARRERVETFNNLTREGFSEPNVPELIDYVRRYRQMPQRPPIGHRFRKLSGILRTAIDASNF